MKKYSLLFFSTIFFGFKALASHPDSSRFTVGVFAYNPVQFISPFEFYFLESAEEQKNMDIGAGFKGLYSFSGKMYLQLTAGYGTGNLSVKDSSKRYGFENSLFFRNQKVKQRSLFLSAGLGSSKRMGNFEIHGGPSIFYNQLFDFTSQNTSETLYPLVQGSTIKRYNNSSDITYPKQHSFGAGFTAGIRYFFTSGIAVFLDVQQYYAFTMFKGDIKFDQLEITEYNNNQPTRTQARITTQKFSRRSNGFTDFIPFLGISVSL